METTDISDKEEKCSDEDATGSETGTTSDKPEKSCTEDPTNQVTEPIFTPESGGFKLPTLPIPAPLKSRKSEPSVEDKSTAKDPTLEKHPALPVPEPESELHSTDEPESNNFAEPSPSSDGLNPSSDSLKSSKSPAEMAKAKALPLPYLEPSWGGVPDKEYCLEVLKNGTIADTIRLKDKSFFVVGRLANCDIILEHPSLSR